MRNDSALIRKSQQKRPVPLQSQGSLPHPGARTRGETAGRPDPSTKGGGGGDRFPTRTPEGRVNGYSHIIAIYPGKRTVHLRSCPRWGRGRSTLSHSSMSCSPSELRRMDRTHRRGRRRRPRSGVPLPQRCVPPSRGNSILDHTRKKKRHRHNDHAQWLTTFQCISIVQHPGWGRALI
eukprot:gene7091-biopygen16504